MSLNKEKVINFINNKLEAEKCYYPKAIFEDLTIDVYFQSFGSCGVRLHSENYGEQTGEGFYRYKDIEYVVFKFVSNAYYRYLENYYHDHQKNPFKKGLDFLGDLYEHKAKSNCDYYEIKSKDKPNLLIIFLGSYEFLIVNHYWGVVACGVRSFDYDTETAKYTIKEIGEHMARSRLANACQKYERERLNIKSVKVDFVGDR